MQSFLVVTIVVNSNTIKNTHTQKKNPNLSNAKLRELPIWYKIKHHLPKDNVQNANFHQRCKI